MIRKATEHDLAEIVLFILECHEAMHWKDHGLYPDEESLIPGVLALFESPRAILAVVEIEGRIEGVCAASVQPYACNKNILVASEWIWHMRPSFPEGLTKNKWFVRMLDFMASWAKGMGAQVFKANAADVAPGSLLERSGFKAMETVCVGRL